MIYARLVGRDDPGAPPVGTFNFSSLTALPLFVVYFSLSMYIIAGVALGGVKG